MRSYFLVLFTSCILNTTAQSILLPNDSAYVRMIDLPKNEPFDTAHPYNRVKDAYLYIISDKELYELFGYDLSMTMRDFNFADHHILGQRVCRQCFFYCQHGKGKSECHRNRCMYEWVWTVRDNKTAFKKIPTLQFPGFIGADLPQFILRDTMIRSSDTAAWYTTGHGDCHARFEYELYADHFYPNLLLKEHNYYGGCRAGGSKNATIRFMMPPGTWNRIKRTILRERFKNDRD